MKNLCCCEKRGSRLAVLLAISVTFAAFGDSHGNIGGAISAISSQDALYGRIDEMDDISPLMFFWRCGGGLALRVVPPDAGGEAWGRRISLGDSTTQGIAARKIVLNRAAQKCAIFCLDLRSALLV